MVKLRPLPVRPEYTKPIHRFPAKPSLTLPPKLPTGPLKPIDWKKVLGTLSLKDRLVAGQLDSTLGAHVNSLKGKLAEMQAPSATLKPGKDGVMYGPEGQPLVTVKLDGGKTAYVDPNTNQYYLPNDDLRYFKKPDSVIAKGPMALPEGAQFSNSYFTVDEVKQLNRITHPPRLGVLLGSDSGFEK